MVHGFKCINLVCCVGFKNYFLLIFGIKLTICGFYFILLHEKEATVQYKSLTGNITKRQIESLMMFSIKNRDTLIF